MLDCYCHQHPLANASNAQILKHIFILHNKFVKLQKKNYAKIHAKNTRPNTFLHTTYPLCMHKYVRMSKSSFFKIRGFGTWDLLNY